MGTDARNLYVIGPEGEKLTLADLPLPSIRRWVPRRKAQVVAAVHGGLLSFRQACDRYALTAEEFLAWEDAMNQFGLAGLRATHAQEYRHMLQHRPPARGADRLQRRF